MAQVKLQAIFSQWWEIACVCVIGACTPCHVEQNHPEEKAAWATDVGLRHLHLFTNTKHEPQSNPHSLQMYVTCSKACRDSRACRFAISLSKARPFSLGYCSAEQFKGFWNSTRHLCRHCSILVAPCFMELEDTETWTSVSLHLGIHWHALFSASKIVVSLTFSTCFDLDGHISSTYSYPEKASGFASMLITKRSSTYTKQVHKVKIQYWLAV
jgi:hypothetical protein